jgi:hypothetical protein
VLKGKIFDGVGAARQSLRGPVLFILVFTLTLSILFVTCLSSVLKVKLLIQFKTGIQNKKYAK